MCSENMPPMRAPRPLLAFGCLLAAGLLVAGCGGGSSSTSGEGGGAAANAESRPAPPASDFPASTGHSLEEVVNLADHPAQLGISPAATVFYEGANRYPFGVFEKGAGSESGKAESELTDAEVAIYYACMPAPVRVRGTVAGKAGKGAKQAASKPQRKVLEEPAVGPFPARIESLSAKPQFESRTTSESPRTARVVYSADLNLPAGRECRPAALIKEGDELGGKVLPGFEPGEFTEVPRVGDRPPQIHTPTAQDVGGDLAKITTRVPPDTLNKVDFAEVLGKEPIVLLFATPQFCQSRVCGPVVDVAREAQQKFGGQASFIHMEIYNENDPGEGVREQVRQFHLPSEPWLFTINREGRISAAVEGAFGPELLDKDVEEAVSE
jgi:hypothetical protein